MPTARGNLGLGNSAVLNVGTAAGTVAAGNDSRIVNAVQSSAYNADVAPAAGQALVFNGTEWVPTTGFPSFSKKTANQTFNSTTVADVTGLSFAVTSGVTYKYKFYVLYTSAATTTGLKLGVSYPAAVASANARIAYAGDGGNSYFEGSLTSATDTVTATAVAATGTVYIAYVEGMVIPTANGTLQLRAGSEVNGSNVIVQANSFVEVTVVP